MYQHYKGMNLPLLPTRKLFYSHQLEWFLWQCTVLTVCTSDSSKHERIILRWIFKNGIQMGMHLAQDGNWCALMDNSNKILHWNIIKCAHITHSKQNHAWTYSYIDKKLYLNNKNKIWFKINGNKTCVPYHVRILLNVWTSKAPCFKGSVGWLLT
jgi:hypothetical protein